MSAAVYAAANGAVERHKAAAAAGDTAAADVAVEQYEAAWDAAVAAVARYEAAWDAIPAGAPCRWVVDDGNGAVDVEAESAQEAAHAFVDGGDWDLGEDHPEVQISVLVWPAWIDELEEELDAWDDGYGFAFDAHTKWGESLWGVIPAEVAP